MVTWEGRWITDGTDDAVAPLLRRSFDVPDGVVGGRLHVAGLGLHRTTLNGVPVTDARLESGLSAYDRRVVFSSYDVALGSGEAVLGIELGRGFYAMTTPNVWWWEQAPWRDVRKALVQLDLLDAEGSVVGHVVSDADWQWSPGPTRFDSYYEGETYDARYERSGWDAPGYDASDWSPIQPVDAPAGVLVPQSYEPVRVIDTLDVVTWLGGDGSPLVADFGTMIAGWAGLSADGLPAGTEIRMIFGEQLEPDGSVLAANQHVLTDRFNTDIVITGDGPLQWERRFGYTGFRYVQVEGVADLTMITRSMISLRARHVHNDVASVSEFDCSDPVLTWIDRAMRLTVRNNLHHVPTDTPVYEKNGWTGDAQVACEAMLGQFDLERLLIKWLDDMADSQRDDGLIPVIIPSAGWGYADLAPAPEWTTLYPYLLERLITWYDRPDLAARHLAPVTRYLDHELGRIDADGLTSGVLGDYLTPGSRGTPPHDDLRIAASCYLVRALRSTADLLADDPDTAGRFRTAADSLADALNATFLDLEQGCYRSEREPGYRQTSNILPVAFGITPAEHVPAVVDSIVADLHAHDDHHDAGCLGLSELFGVLSEHGHADLAIRVATRPTPPSWGAWMRSGESSLREMWGAESRSHNHYFMGAMARWLYADVAGVRLLAKGWAEFTVDPRARADLAYASYFYDGPRGRLGARWEQRDGSLTLSVTVPPDSRARVQLPDREPFWVGPGEWSYDAAPRGGVR